MVSSTIFIYEIAIFYTRILKHLQNLNPKVQLCFQSTNISGVKCR